MTNTLMDNRLKVIRFQTSLHGMNIAAKQSILWPCNAFSISIPQKKKNGLNVFEELILKFTEIESGNLEKIADITCLEKELVSFIQSRLNQLGLIDNRNNISKEGKNLLDSWRNIKMDNMEYVSGTIFFDLLTGRLIPYIHIGNLKYESILSKDNNFVDINTGTAGKSKLKSCRRICQSNNSYMKTVPDSNDIIRAFREFKKIYKKHVFLSQSDKLYPPTIPIAEAISINKNPEMVYLYCEILIQIGNNDLLVTDGSGFGFSESFANYLKTQNWQWVIDLKKKAIIENLSVEAISDERNKKISWNFPEVTRRFIYDSKDGSTMGIDSLLKCLVNVPKTTSEEKSYIENRQQLISKLYSAMEWSLRYLIGYFPVDEWKQIYKAGNYKSNKILLSSFASKIGFSVTEKNQSILQIKSGALRQIEQGKVELQPLLALAITGAASKYSTHPLHILAKNHSGLLSFISHLKLLRDPIEHGDVSDYKIDLEQLIGISEKTKNIIITMLPSIISELNENENDFIESIDINQERLKSQNQLENEIGFVFFSGLSPDIKELLIRCELLLKNFSNNLPQEIIKCLSSAIQLSLFEVIKEFNFYNSDKTDIKKIAIEKIVCFGFHSSISSVPEEIKTVNNQRLHCAVQGKNITLGANLLSVFYLASENELIKLKNSYPSFTEFLAYLIRLRGHGNEQQHNFSLSNMKSLKNSVLKTIKIITEVF